MWTTSGLGQCVDYVRYELVCGPHQVWVSVDYVRYGLVCGPHQVWVSV